jgi:hypothetical protein
VNTQLNTQQRAHECFVPVRAERRPLTCADWELQLRPFAVQAESRHSELLQPGTAPRAPYFVEVYVARPVSRVPRGWVANGDTLEKIQNHLCHRFESGSSHSGR